MPETNYASILGAPGVVPSGMEWLRQRIGDLGKKGVGLARALDLPKERIYEMYRGARRFQQDEIVPAARFLELTTDQLTALIDGKSLQEVLSNEGVNMRRDGAPVLTLVVWRTTVRGGQRGGAFMLTSDQVGKTYRPEFLEFATKAFAFKVLNHENDPVYKLRETLLVNPEQVVDLGDDCVFTSEPELPSGAVSIVGCLVRSGTSHWVIRQYGNNKEQELPKKDFPNAWRIVARYMASVD